jgi:hypothetical protein
MKLGQTIEALVISSRQKTIPELHAVIWEIADQCRKLVSHKNIISHRTMCVFKESNEVTDACAATKCEYGNDGSTQSFLRRAV